jgi:hypothetical protein
MNISYFLNHLFHLFDYRLIINFLGNFSKDHLVAIKGYMHYMILKKSYYQVRQLGIRQLGKFSFIVI